MKKRNYWVALGLFILVGTLDLLLRGPEDPTPSADAMAAPLETPPPLMLRDPNQSQQAPTLPTKPMAQVSTQDFDSLLEMLRKEAYIPREWVQEWIIHFQQGRMDHSQYYDRLVELYRSGLPEGSRIFLARFLGEIQTPLAAQALMGLLALPSDPQVVYENRRAIDDLIFDNVEGRPNVALSPVLVSYWESTKDDLYKVDIARAIAKLGTETGVTTLVRNFEERTGTEATQEAVRSSIRQIRSVEGTAVLVHAYFDPDSDAALKEATLEAMPYIANETAVHFIYEWSSTVATTEEIQQMQAYLEVLLQRNPDGENLIKEHLYTGKIPFASEQAKAALEATVKGQR